MRPNWQLQLPTIQFSQSPSFHYHIDYYRLFYKHGYNQKPNTFSRLIFLSDLTAGFVDFLLFVSFNILFAIIFRLVPEKRSREPMSGVAPSSLPCFSCLVDMH
jgi:hypothetical protein